MSELSPRARELLQQGRESFSPSAQELQATRAALFAKLSAFGPDSAAQQTEPKYDRRVRLEPNAVGASGSVKLGAVALVAFTAAAAYVGLLGHDSRPSARNAAGGRAAVIGAAVPLSNKRATVQPSPSSTVVPATVAVRQVRSQQAARAEVAWVQRKQRSTAAGARTRVHARARPQRRNDASENAAARSDASSGRSGQAQPSQLSAAGVSSPERPIDTLALETALVRKAQAALEHGNAALALEIANQYAVQFSSGLLRQEQLALRARALCSLGQLDAGRAVLRRILEISPGSPHRIRIERACKLVK